MGIAMLAALKIYFDVVEEGSGCPLPAPGDIFSLPGDAIMGADDLGHFRASTVDVAQLLSQCAQRYAAITELGGDLLQLVTTCNQRDHWRALQRQFRHWPLQTW